MSIFAGNYLPSFNIRLSSTYINPYVIVSGATGITTGQFIDTNRIYTDFTGASTGTQYNINIVPEKFITLGQVPNISLTSSNTGIGQINVFNNINYINTGSFNVVATYTTSLQAGKTFILPVSLISGIGTTGQTITYSPDTIVPSSHILVVYNSGSTNSTNLKTYYTGHRPQFSGANILGIACSSLESVSYNNFTTGILNPIINYLTGVSGSKPIRYLVMMMDIPTRISDGNKYSVSYELHMAYKNLGYRNGASYQWADDRFSLGKYQGNTCLVSYINFNTFQDCTGYIDKISLNQTGVYLTGNGGNTGYYFEDYNAPFYYNFVYERYLQYTLSGSFPNGQYVYKPTGSSFITTGNNLAGFCSWGANAGRGGDYALDGSIKWGGNNNWYIMTTIESYNMQRNTWQGNYLDWFSSGAFGGLGGTGYDNIPIGAVGHTEEPWLGGVAYQTFYLLWQTGWSFIEAAWQSRNIQYFLCVGDPLVFK